MAEGYLLRGAQVVSDGVQRQADVKIADGRIEQVGDDLAAAGARVVDCGGLHLLPGLIDDQVHFREPGMEHKATIASESAAAVRGGVTSFLEMPNTSPATITAAALDAKLARAAATSCANYGFYLGATGSNCQVLRAAAGLPACGIKVFLGSSTGDLLVTDESELEKVFAAVPPGMVLAAHCEDDQRIRTRLAEHIAEHGEQLPLALHPQIRDHESCLAASQLAIRLARQHKVRLHILHLTTAAELDLLDAGGLAGKMITAEACVHHLWFCDQDYPRLGGLIKCNPAIKSDADRAALRAALTGGRIDVLATDHAPHLLSEKQGNYRAIAAGLPLVEHSLLLMLSLVRAGVLELIDVARLAAHNPGRPVRNKRARPHQAGLLCRSGARRHPGANDGAQPGSKLQVRLVAAGRGGAGRPDRGGMGVRPAGGVGRPPGRGRARPAAAVRARRQLEAPCKAERRCGCCW